MEEITNFTIDRSKWRCGGHIGPYKHGTANTQLKNRDGFMCCLGQICQQILPEHEFDSDEFSPKDIGVVPLFSEMTNGCAANTQLSNDMMSLNDNLEVTPAEREELLIAKGKEHGVTIVFSGEYEKSPKTLTQKCTPNYKPVTKNEYL